MGTVRETYEKQTKRPGKFEGAPAYAPYFWEMGLEGDSDESIETAHGPVEVFVVSGTDAALFPELTVGQRIALYESSDGFITELGPEGVRALERTVCDE